MTKAEALKHVEHMMLAVQKARSNTLETVPNEEMAADLQPWLFGEKCILPTLIDITMSTHTITPSEFSNLMVIANMLEPSIAMCAAARSQDLPEYDLPRGLEWDES